MPGRPRKPTSLKVLEGNRGHQKRHGAEPQPTKHAPRMPSHLAPAAKTLWKLLVRELASMNLLSGIDGAALEGACTAYARAIEADKKLARDGLTFEIKGMKYQRPEVGISNNSWKQFKVFCVEFGLTPASRTKLSVGGTGRAIDTLEAALCG